MKPKYPLHFNRIVQLCVCCFAYLFNLISTIFNDLLHFYLFQKIVQENFTVGQCVVYHFIHKSHILIVKSQWHLIKYNWILMGIKNLVENMETSCCETSFAWKTVSFLRWPKFILYNINRDMEMDARSKQKKGIAFRNERKAENDFKQHILMSCENSTTRTESL